MNDERLEELEILFESYSMLPDTNLQQEIFEAISDKDTPHTFKTKALLFLRKHKSRINLKLFSSIIKIDEDTIQELLDNEITKAYFPIVGKKGSKLSTLYVIRLNNRFLKSFKNNIQNTLTITKNLTHKNFFVFFEDDFSGNSFMLALVASLISKNPYTLENYSFSGVLDTAGNILDVEFIKEKEIISKENRKKLIHKDITSNLKELLYILNDTKIDLPFCIATKPSTTQNTPKEAAFYNLKTMVRIIEDRFNVKIKSIKKLYGLDDEDFVFYTDKNFIDDKSWKHSILDAHKKIKKLKSKIDDKISVLHLSFLSPSTFSFCIGALLGCKEPFVAYHYSAGKYYAVIDYRNKNPRNLKEIPKNTKHIRCAYSSQSSKTLAMVFYLASHNPIGDVKHFLDKHYLEYDIMQCELNSKQGDIPLKNWSTYVREMYKHYNDTKNYKMSKRLFFFSAPVPLAFGFGVCVETFENADIFNLDFEKEEKYVKILNLTELRI